MDINQILSLLKTIPPAQPPVVEQPQIPTAIDLALIDQDVIDQVRNEYWAKQKASVKQEEEQDNSLDSLLVSLASATSITPDVLGAVARMVKETDILDIVKEMKDRQDQKEQEMFEHRQSIEERQKKERNGLFARELIGACKPEELETLEEKIKCELEQVDRHVLRSMDRERARQQIILEKRKVPFFRVTDKPSEMKMQQKMLSILLDMINE
ncbi:hypothetical protein J3Q64DRAFT_1704757 [Phycomyces blakesleeanus]|uniref:Uncharacterized protein n=2 Tax=Phycomyces blakesleeanus TaxID=4837 RepID=A0A162TEB8_PHYB8|nr:hypothetical protein PHYBLDRAFT_152537 [Phycomyces blakesleeanus NRRL 1555(-)]OAD66463.1 hypothetical protein PHYBLDRAFT_152537 [Phycomyces blakesleeanus NRRL 1555(-)]|eukprot:XP_018284503.1 hypothetical protein PHYBLDRAFT_152537 [Phycomyces blakesleeanus NRRL 1555(-)]